MELNNYKKFLFILPVENGFIIRRSDYINVSDSANDEQYVAIDEAGVLEIVRQHVRRFEHLVPNDPIGPSNSSARPNTAQELTKDLRQAGLSDEEVPF